MGCQRSVTVAHSDFDLQLYYFTSRIMYEQLCGFCQWTTLQDNSGCSELLVNLLRLFFETNLVKLRISDRKWCSSSGRERVK